ncbi:MAG: hypothetical protein Q7R99_01645 [bacterium]|nr:hypothetical protein [bacterium]
MKERLVAFLVVMAIVSGCVGFGLLVNFYMVKDSSADYGVLQGDSRLPAPYKNAFKGTPVGFSGALPEGPLVVGYFQQTKGETNVSFVVYHEGYKIIGNRFGTYRVDWMFAEEPTINIYFDRWPEQVFNQKCQKLFSWGDSGYYCQINSLHEFQGVVKKLGGAITTLTP